MVNLVIFGLVWYGLVLYGMVLTYYHAKSQAPSLKNGPVIAVGTKRTLWWWVVGVQVIIQINSFELSGVGQYKRKVVRILSC